MNSIDIANQELNSLLSRYSDTPVSRLYVRYNINPKSKRCKQSLATAIIQNCDNPSLKQFVSSDHVWIKTAMLVRDGQLEASLSLPSFKFAEIVNETWESSQLRKMLSDTIFVLVFYEQETYKKKDVYIKKGLVWKMPQEILDGGVKECWEIVVDCVKNGKIVKYIGNDGRFHTYFPRTSDGPYVHVRPHAATSDSTLPLPVPDKLTGLQEYPMHSFWLTRSYIQKLI